MPLETDLRLELPERVGRRNVRLLIETLRSAEERAPGRLTLDLRRCRSIDVVGACVLLDMARRARRDGCRLTLASPSPLVRRMLELTAVDRAIELDPPSERRPSIPLAPLDARQSEVGA